MFRVYLMFALLPVALAFFWWTWRVLGTISKCGLLSSMIGLFSNLVAIAFNGWQMPVMGVYYIEPRTIWKVAVNPRFPWLVDRFECALGTCSVGDIFLAVGAVLAIGGFLWKFLRLVLTKWE